MQNNCYKVKNGKLGIHKDFAKSLLTQKPGSFFRGRLNLERPTNVAEANILLEFLLGMKYNVVVEGFCNKLNHSGYPSMSSTQFKREIAFAKLEGKDYITTKNHFGESKIELGYFRYEIKGLRDTDGQFNREVFISSYEMEASAICNTIFLERGSGGIGYGQPHITSFKELDFMIAFDSNREGARPEYIEYVKSLYKENKKYIYADLKKKLLVENSLEQIA